MTTSPIIDIEKVTLNQPMVSVVAKMYSREVVEKTIVEKITYLSDGRRVKGYIARPTQAGTFPVLLWNRGGTGDRGALDELRAHLILASTAVWGYVVLATQYRGNMGGDGQEEWGCSDVADSLNLLEVAKHVPQADLSRVGIEGASRGGMTTYCALRLHRDFKCAIVHAAITDVFDLVEKSERFSNFLDERFIDLSPDERRAEYAERSAVYFADKLPREVPILLLHGTEDKVIPLDQSVAMARELSRVGIEHELVTLAGGGHHAHKDGSYVEMDRHRHDWLSRYLA